MAEQIAGMDSNDVLPRAPAAPKRSRLFYLFVLLACALLAWSFHGAKIRPAELIEGIPQVFATLGRMLPPDFVDHQQ